MDSIYHVQCLKAFPGALVFIQNFLILATFVVFIGIAIKIDDSKSCFPFNRK